MPKAKAKRNTKAPTGAKRGRPKKNEMPQTTRGNEEQD
jgi:hypothetical protein